MLSGRSERKHQEDLISLSPHPPSPSPLPKRCKQDGRRNTVAARKCTLYKCRCEREGRGSTSSTSANGCCRLISDSPNKKTIRFQEIACGNNNAKTIKVRQSHSYSVHMQTVCTDTTIGSLLSIVQVQTCTSAHTTI